MIPRVTEILALHPSRRYIAASPERMSEGREVHRLCAAGVQSDPVLQSWLDSWFAVRRDLTIEPLQWEFEIYYKAQKIGCRSIEYIGHPDCLAYVGGELTLVELKTGGKSDSDKLQLIAYWMGQERKARRQLIIYLRPQSLPPYCVEEIEALEVPQLWLEFTALYRLWCDQQEAASAWLPTGEVIFQ